APEFADSSAACGDRGPEPSPTAFIALLIGAIPCAAAAAGINKPVFRRFRRDNVSILPPHWSFYGGFFETRRVYTLPLTCCPPGIRSMRLLGSHCSAAKFDCGYLLRRHALTRDKLRHLNKVFLRARGNS